MKRGGYNVMKIGIGNDHAAVDMKNQVVEYLEGKGYDPRKLLKPGCDAITAKVVEMCGAFGSADKA